MTNPSCSCKCPFCFMSSDGPEVELPDTLFAKAMVCVVPGIERTDEFSWILWHPARFFIGLVFSFVFSILVLVYGIATLA